MYGRIDSQKNIAATLSRKYSLNLKNIFYKDHKGSNNNLTFTNNTFMSQALNDSYRAELDITRFFGNEMPAILYDCINGPCTC